MDERNLPQPSQGLGENIDPLEQDLPKGHFFDVAWQRLKKLGMTGKILRVGGVMLTMSFIVVVIWVMNNFYTSVRGTRAAEISAPGTVQTRLNQTQAAVLPQLDQKSQQLKETGVARDAALHTILPSRGREELMTYTVVPGDSLFSIAQKFSLRTETLLWGNLYTIGDDPHLIYPGQQILILPVDGTLHKWIAGEGLNAVAEHFHVTPESIVNYPGNHLDPKTIGDYAHPNIKADTLIIIPGGYAEFPDWRTPRITRAEPATAKNLGPGACEGSYDGVIGTGNFIWPTEKHYLSGYDFDPASNHYGIDLAGEMGEKIKAADNGVIVYAGLNDWGYGNMVVIDHGKGWQTLYAHMATITVKCGQEVYQGDQIGTVGDTGMAQGAHLHFELRSDELGRLDPKLYLK